MRIITCKWSVVFFLACWRPAMAEAPRHYVFFNRDRGRISEASFLETKAFAGAQLKYTWRELEPGEDEYDFSAIRHDLSYLVSKGKRLFVQLQDVSFDPKIINVPDYLKTDPQYHGGADKQYSITDDDEDHAAPEGWVARRWDPAVRARFHKLLQALGREFDGKIEGIVLPETSVTFGESGRLFPMDFSPDAYRDAVISNMDALRRAFPNSVTIQYANFMPGEWLPENDRGYLWSIYEHAQKIKVGVGGPDLLPFKPPQMKHAYRFLPTCAGKVPIGIAVQEGNYQHKPPGAAHPVTVAELIDFAEQHLKVDYIFWCTQEPYYSEKLIPHVRRASGG